MKMIFKAESHITAYNAKPNFPLQFQSTTSGPLASRKRLKLTFESLHVPRRSVYLVSQARSSSSSDPPSAAGAPSPSSTSSQEDEVMVPEVGWLWSKKGAASPKQILRQQNIRPKKTLGQHFMFDESILQSVAEAAKLSPGDLVLEIGPGTGGLTRFLLAAGAQVTAVEKDYALHDKLAEEYSTNPTLKLVCGDIMRQNIPQLLDDMLQSQSKPLQQQELNNAAAGGGGDIPNPSGSTSTSDCRVKVVANLPYNITKECLNATLPLSSQISHLILMVQDEVAHRLTNNKPGSSDWRAMNVIVQYYCQPTYLFKVDKKLYTPPPQVHGAVVDFRLLTPDQRPSIPNERFFLKLVKTSFLQRRKLLKNSLAVLFGGSELVGRALKEAGVEEDARAQALGLEEFVKLSWSLYGLLEQEGGGKIQQEA